MAKFGGPNSETRFFSATGITLLCALIALILLLVLPLKDSRVEWLRQASFDLLSPAIELVNWPVLALRDGGTRITNMVALTAENEQLKIENRKLREKVTELTQTKVLMEQYRNLLSLPPEPSFSFVYTRIVSDVSSPFAQTVVANNGRAAGIEQGDVVMGVNGLVGRVISVGETTARILLLTDFNSHIPVIALSSNVPAILSGRNNEPPQLEFLPRNANLKEGDLLVTSGSGGQIPIGLPVASIEKTAADKWRVRLLDDVHRLLHVRVVKSASIDTSEIDLQIGQGLP